MTAFRATDDSGHTIDEIDPVSLRGLLRGAQEFVILENPEWGPEFYAQALRLDGEWWRVEVRGGAAERHVGTDVPSEEAAYDVLRSWAAADGWWQEAFTWTPVET